MYILRNGVFAVVALTCVSGCVSYHARPLLPLEVVASVARERQQPDASAAKLQEPLTLERAAGWLAAHGPSIKEARAAYESALAVSKIKTPLPNPSLEVGPNFSFGADVLKYRNQPFGSIGFTIPTGKRLKRQDELNRLQAERARVDMEVQQRLAYLELRRLLGKYALARTKLGTLDEIATSTASSRDLMRKQMNAGQGNALDLNALDLEAARTSAEPLKARDEVLALEGELSRLMGVDAALFRDAPAAPLLELSERMPDATTLQNLLTSMHPELAQLRAQYEVAEGQLRLEIAKQYPDFRFGPSFEKDGGSLKTTLGLTLGIELPIFDQNQQGVAMATQSREETRVKYEAAANRALAKLDQAKRRLDNALKRAQAARGEWLPKAREGVTLTRKAFDAGQLTLPRMLEAERAERNARLEALDAELSARQAWMDLEEAAGAEIELMDVKVSALESPESDFENEVPPAEDATEAELSETERK